MAQTRAKIRLFVEAGLATGAAVTLGRAQTHYLGTVMRQGPGAGIGLFNGRDGEWTAQITALSRRETVLECVVQTRAQAAGPDLWLCFAPIKKARTDFIVEKAAELGCSRVVPVLTRRTESQRVNAERWRQHMIEAAEQCGLLGVPDLAAPVRLGPLLAGWPSGRRLMFCDETAPRPAAASVLASAPGGPWAVLIGPEGGFAPEEAAALAALDHAHAVSLGPRIMRADTAAVAALALWQAMLGDWR